MSFFRSEVMRLCQIVLYKETAFDCLLELGYLGKVEFKNTALSDPVYDKDELNQLGIRTYYYPNVDLNHKPNISDLRDIEEVLLKLETELNEVIHRCMDLKKVWIALLERREVLLRADGFLVGTQRTEAQINYDALLLSFLRNSPTKEIVGQSDETLTLRFIAGTVPMKTFAAFELMVWRVSRGNSYLKREPIELEESIVGSHGINRFKYIFIVTFVGEEMQAKLSKVCQGFGVRVYDCPVLKVDREEALEDNATELSDVKEVYMQTLEHKQRILASPVMDLFIWRSKIDKIRAIYLVLSRLHQMEELSEGQSKYVEAECWIPKRDVAIVRKALLRGARRGLDGNVRHLVFPPILNVVTTGADLHTPPTLFQTNKFTKAFQDLVDSYGIAAYREINPAPFSIVTFPFLFSVMFSDLAHGIILTVMALCLIGFEQKYTKHQRDRTEPNEVFDLLFAGRYIMLLCGAFSIYSGFIFNNLFSKTMNIFGSNWRVNFTLSDVETNQFLQLDPARLDNFLGNPYLFGFDPVWDCTSRNWITVNNSLKMKASIVLGVAHMIFGLFLSAANAVYFNDKMEIYLKFLPQLVFMCSIFLYLVILIFQKWLCYGGNQIKIFSPGCAPSLFNTFLNMLFFKEPLPAPEGCLSYIYDNQPIVQRFLVVVAILCVLVHLCGYPVHHFLSNRVLKFKKGRPIRASSHNTRKPVIAFDIQHLNSSELLAKSKFSEVCIQNFISTVDSVLSTISHTASYLRLWALSLAHGELTFLVWKMVFPVAFRTRRGYWNSLIIFINFAIFAVLNVFFLVIMEGLAVFMHTLRLHWFEFQSKFYRGNGHAFTPFRFKRSIRMDEKT